MLIKNATIVNEGKIFQGSLLIEDGKIARIIPAGDDNQLSSIQPRTSIDATGMLLLPGVIDTHVHFREPGLTDKADFHTESRAAAAGGVTSIVDMPNTKPQTTSLAELEEKERIAAEKSIVNYGFMLGATNDNIDYLLSIDPSRYAAIKLFLGSSTGNMLVDNNDALDHLFKDSKKLIVAHAENEAIINANMANYTFITQFTQSRQSLVNHLLQSARQTSLELDVVNVDEIDMVDIETLHTLIYAFLCTLAAVVPGVDTVLAVAADLG